MSSLKHVDRIVINEFLDSGTRYVLDFNKSDLWKFLEDVGVDMSKEWFVSSDSQLQWMKNLIANENDVIVSDVLSELLKVWVSPNGAGSAKCNKVEDALYESVLNIVKNLRSNYNKHQHTIENIKQQQLDKNSNLRNEVIGKFVVAFDEIKSSPEHSVVKACSILEWTAKKILESRDPTFPAKSSVKGLVNTVIRSVGVKHSDEICDISKFISSVNSGIGNLETLRAENSDAHAEKAGARKVCSFRASFLVNFASNIAILLVDLHESS